MGANARIVTAELGAHPGVSRRIVSRDALPTVLERRLYVSPEKGSRPAAMKRLELQIRIRHLLAERDKLLGPVACNFELAAGNGVVPESPRRLEQPDAVAANLSCIVRELVGLCDFRALD